MKRREKTALSSDLTLDCVWKVLLSVETWTEQLSVGVVLFPQWGKEKWRSEYGPMAKQEGGEWASKRGRSHINRLFHLQRCVTVCVIEAEEEVVCRGVVRGNGKTNGPLI